MSFSQFTTKSKENLKEREGKREGERDREREEGVKGGREEGGMKKFHTALFHIYRIKRGKTNVP
jgi:hypothetical protein